MKYIFIVSFPIRIKKLYQSVVVAEELQVLQKGAECLIRIGLFLQNQFLYSSIVGGSRMAYRRTAFRVDLSIISFITNPNPH